MTHSTKDTKSNDITSSDGISVALGEIKMSNCTTRHRTQKKRREKGGIEINCQKALEAAPNSFVALNCCLSSFFLATCLKRNVQPCSGKKRGN